MQFKVLKLQHLSVQVIAGSIWTLAKFRNSLMPRSKANPNRYPCYNDKWRQMYMLLELRSLMNNLNLPKRLVNELLEDILILGESIKSWLERRLFFLAPNIFNLKPFHGTNLESLVVFDILPEPFDIGQYLVWDPLGGLDERNTTRKLLKSGSLLDWHRILLAGRFFVHSPDEADSLQEYLVVLQERHQTDYIVEARVEWEDDHIPLVRSMDMPESCQDSVRSGNIFGVKFHWYNIRSQDARKATLTQMLQAHERARRTVTTYINSSSPVDVIEIGRFFLANCMNDANAACYFRSFPDMTYVVAHMFDLYVWQQDEYFSHLLDKVCNRIGSAYQSNLFHIFFERIVMHQQNHLLPHLIALWLRVSGNGVDVFNSTWFVPCISMVQKHGYSNLKALIPILQLVKSLQPKKDIGFLSSCLIHEMRWNGSLDNLDRYLETFVCHSNNELRDMKGLIMDTSDVKGLVQSLRSNEKSAADAQVLLQWAFQTDADVERYERQLIKYDIKLKICELELNRKRKEWKSSSCYKDRH